MSGDGMAWQILHNYPLATRRWGIGIAVATFALIAANAHAQQQLRIPRSSVEVDWSVLDELDSRPSAPARLVTPAARPAARATTPAQRPVAQAQRAPAPPTRTAANTAAARANSGAAPSFTPPAAPPTFSDAAPPRSLAPSTSPALVAPTLTPPPPPTNLAAPTPLTPPTAVAQNTPAPAPIPAPVAEAPAPAPAAPPPPPALAPPPPPVAAAPTPAPAPQVASLPPAAPPATANDGAIGRITFGANASELPTEAKAVLDRAVAGMKQDESTRLQIVAYATGGDEAGSQARRLSLSRALAVRSYLIDQGVRSTRMDVRALGNRAADGGSVTDRVDMVIVRR